MGEFITERPCVVGFWLFYFLVRFFFCLFGGRGDLGRGGGWDFRIRGVGRWGGFVSRSKMARVVCLLCECVSV